ncbi:hypothetical protein QBC34DRAFT_492590 [Podospora aff. communis PSN243]|uniref:Uncharacterized protein n=1 Tax=Podospora aff. communis PSN243 TaxID=3040156 RepID=A0AAV9GXM1_9PEZI|nr:hypothetical protein QBC34DRAFT_492590 [Podospora aff. communis PSN243]
MTARQSTTAVLCLAALLAARLIPFAEATWIPHHSNVAVRDDPVRGTKEEYALGSGPGYNYVEGSQGRHHEPQDHDVIPIWDLGPSQGAAHPAGGLRVSVSMKAYD